MNSFIPHPLRTRAEPRMAQPHPWCHSHIFTLVSKYPSIGGNNILRVTSSSSQLSLAIGKGHGSIRQGLANCIQSVHILGIEVSGVHILLSQMAVPFKVSPTRPPALRYETLLRQNTATNAVREKKYHSDRLTRQLRNGQLRLRQGSRRGRPCSRWCRHGLS